MPPGAVTAAIATARAALEEGGGEDRVASVWVNVRVARGLGLDGVPVQTLGHGERELAALGPHPLCCRQVRFHHRPLRYPPLLLPALALAVVLACAVTPVCS
eukprot:225133-Rhodomonas_salina.1